MKLRKNTSIVFLVTFVFLFVLLFIYLSQSNQTPINLTLPTPASQISPAEEIPPISDLELNRGWYYGFSNQKKPGTPESWIFSEAGRSSCWHKSDIQCGQ